MFQTKNTSQSPFSQSTSGTAQQPLALYSMQVILASECQASGNLVQPETDSDCDPQDDNDEMR